MPGQQRGNDADSNILKIYGMLPGIGTYVNTRSISHTSRLARLNSWYQKAKDSAVGTSFDEHVMGAYKFLMQCYNDDDIFIFGFSRGAYVARFLAEMLDHVGLLSQGNEEMARFAWKAFSQWQEREDNTEEEKKKKKDMLQFLWAFRETFSRPVRRIRFLGLFDTVNSVPRFENAWMKRSKFPYTARSSAKIIRHAVSIDERRAKFRSDLISESKSSKPRQDSQRGRGPATADRFRRRSAIRPMGEYNKQTSARLSAVNGDLLDPGRGKDARVRSQSPAISQSLAVEKDGSSIRSMASVDSSQMILDAEDDEDDEAAPQDLEELWFPGCHADLGGGWPLAEGEESPLSHGPLVWMVREAQRAGLEFDTEKIIKLKCCDDDYNDRDLGSMNGQAGPNVPEIEVTASPSLDIFHSPHAEKPEPGWVAGMEPKKPAKSVFQQNLESAATKGVLHDCLEFRNGLTAASVISWKIMEYMPFRRMDLRPDGSWKAISWPLPMGETRDIPENACIHLSAIRRMEADERYRPGNLIIGGGGRGVRRAPKEAGIGNWEILKGHDDPVGMVYIRKGPSIEKQIDKQTHPKEERTFLAWLRTSLAFASIGIAVTQLFRLNTTISEREGYQPNNPDNTYHLRQYWIIRGKFPASRGSVLLVTFVAMALIVTSLVIVCVVDPSVFEKK
ncbi:putative membrane protein, partial [Lecanoromycetidae sp. Uapishka_2]